MPRPEKIKNVLQKISYCVEMGNYILTKHAIDRQIERTINLPEVLYVLKNGREEKSKSCLDEVKKTWKYAIRGKTKATHADIRIIVAFKNDGMLIITVMYVGDR